MQPAPPPGSDSADISLDDLYHMTAVIYREQNLERTTAATFAHFVETCGMLCSLDRNKRRAELKFEDALCKALAWYFPLLAKHNVRSAERLIFLKYPQICPYCGRAPHVDADCKSVRGVASGRPNPQEFLAISDQRWVTRPRRLDDWQRMFQDIYPRSTDDRTGRSSLGLLEEIGELGEAIRVFDRYPKYFAGEAADVFSYLMGLANEHSLRLARDDQRFSLEDEYLVRYPGFCTECGESVCQCPSIPEATVGRLAKELDIDEDIVFGGSPYHTEETERTTQIIFSRLSGSATLLEHFPLDRGNAHDAAIRICRELAEKIRESDPILATTLENGASRLEGLRTEPGEPRSSEEAAEVATEIVGIIERTPASMLEEVEASMTPEFGSLGELVVPRLKHVLTVSAAPIDQETIRPHAEALVIDQAIERSRYRNKFRVDHLPAAQWDALRHRLLDKDISILHIAGHGGSNGLVFEQTDGSSQVIPFDVLSGYLSADRFPTIECILMNACYSLTEIATSIAPVTIGMTEAINDESAIEFARGFYDAVGSGRNYRFAVEEGLYAVEAKGLPRIDVRVLPE